MNKTASIIITCALVVGIGILFLGSSKSIVDPALNEAVQNVEVRVGIQYVTIEAKGGYSPRVSTAQSGIPTKLIVKTNSTYDCSLALVIRSIGYQKMLSQTGEEIIDIGAQEKNSSLQGTCSMGMYSFKVNFN